jgi:hypothetical protein
MDKKQLYGIWAYERADVWTRYVKPVLFVHAEFAPSGFVREAVIPVDVQRYFSNETMVIVDLPGASGVETGLGLAKIGFRPIPLYNGIHENNNGGRKQAVDNTAIINAIANGTDNLRRIYMQDNAPPAFLLDANRNTPQPDMETLYDNRWSVDTDDMPTADYLKANHISRILVWTNQGIQNDIKTILQNYQNEGIHITAYTNGQFYDMPTGLPQPITPEPGEPATPIIVPEIKEAVRKYENARFAMLMVAIMAGVNFISMYFILEEPILWTAPAIMWLTYLWVPEAVGDILAFLFVLAFFVLYFISARKQEFQKIMPIAFAYFCFEIAVLYIYALYYDFTNGFMEYIGHEPVYGVIVFGAPLVVLFFVYKGVAACKKLTYVSDDEYLTYLDYIDGYTEDGIVYTPGYGGHRRARRILRSFRGANYRGYSGYGGSGRIGGGYGRFGGGGFGG